ncbi:sulfotransferase [Flavilitoribacter nigricans]|uniref:sulfotransferase n=1 Tax=Flavilitoribacter nigricans TaxID=70997 RepID=UPI00147410F2|nr:sulfotransferase [Flavilitoribacter nigricans]
MPVKYIYILSQRYSGSTLLSFLLATHPEISTIGERRKFFVKSIRPKGQTGLQCSCGALFQDCVYWTAVREKVLARIDERALGVNETEFQLYGNKYLEKLGQEILQRAILDGWPLSDHLFAGRRRNWNTFNRRLVEVILEMDNSRIFLDSSKSIEQVLYLSQIDDFDLHIIWLTRDPRAQVASSLKYNSWSVEEATRRWKQQMQKNQFVLDRLGIKYTTLTYEALCRDPKGEIRQLLKFVGMDPGGFSLNFRDYEQHIMGNYRMRLGQDTRIVERKDWLERLQPGEIAKIESMTSDYREYYTTV